MITTGPGAGIKNGYRGVGRLFQVGGTIVGLIVLPLQCILVNTCMHDQPKKCVGGGGGGGGGTSTRCPPGSYPWVIIIDLLSSSVCTVRG